MFHHYIHALTPILNPFVHLLLHYALWVTLSPSGIQLLDNLAPALTLTLTRNLSWILVLPSRPSLCP